MAQYLSRRRPLWGSCAAFIEMNAPRRNDRVSDVRHKRHKRVAGMRSLNNSRVYRTFACIYQKTMTGVHVVRAAARWLYSAAANFYELLVTLSSYTATFLSSTPWFFPLRKFFLCVLVSHCESSSSLFLSIFYSYSARLLLAKSCSRDIFSMKKIR